MKLDRVADRLRDSTGDQQERRAGARREPVRILHVTGTLERGGIETWLSQALIRLPRDRYQCDVCIYRKASGHFAAALEQYGCAVFFVPLRNSLFGILKFATEFRQMLRSRRYDIVHCHTLMLGSFLLFLAWREGIPVRIGHSHNTDHRISSAPARVLNRFAMMLNRPLARVLATHGVACSGEAGEALFGPQGRGRANYEVIHCGIDLTRFATGRAALRSELLLPADAKVIGHVSNFSLQKNPLFLAEIAAAAMKDRTDVWLLLVGDGVLRADVHQRCLNLGIGSRVIFTGVVSNVPDLMRSAIDIFVLPSINEGLPLVVVEAQAAGLPCLVSDAVSREVSIVEGAVHFLALNSGPEKWADAALRLIDTFVPPSDGLRRMEETDFNIEISTARLAELYDAAQFRSSPSSIHNVQS